MSFPRYPEYKDSGVEWLGEVPRHWDVQLVKNLASIVNGYPFDSALFDATDGSPLIRIRDLNKSEAETFYKGDFVEAAAITSDDVLIGMDGDFNVGRWRGEGRALLNQRMCCVRGKNKVVTRLLEYTLPIRLKAINDVTYATTVKHLASSQVEKTLVAIPLDVAEQTQIAVFLDRETAKIDALVAEQRRLMDLLKEKRQAVISHVVTRGLNPHAPMKPSGNKWLGDVPTHWVVCCLKHIKAEVKNAFVDGPFGSNLKSEHFIDDGDVYVIESNFATQGRIDTDSLKTISNEHFATINRSETRGGDIVIAKIGAQYGKASILPPLDKPAVVSGNSLKLTINNETCDVKFVNWHLANLKELGVMEDIVNATAQPALSLGEMNNLPMLVPPRNEQEAIVQFLNEKLGEFDTLTTEAQLAIDLLQERRTALISAAVTGQIDVRATVTA
mgnify:CR=1 FL=1